TITVVDDKDPTRYGQPVKFTAIVKRTPSTAGRVTRGAIQFVVDGRKVGRPIELNARGQATWTTSRLPEGTHKVAAIYLPGENSVSRTRGSPAEQHTVIRERPPNSR